MITEYSWDQLHLLTIEELEELLKRVALYEDLIDQVLAEKLRGQE